MDDPVCVSVPLDLLVDISVALRLAGEDLTDALDTIYKDAVTPSQKRQKAFIMNTANTALDLHLKTQRLLR